MNPQQNYKIIVKGIIKDKEGRFLLLQTKDGYWDLPGGHLNFGETPEECLKREIKEEIGCMAEIDCLVFLQTIILECTKRKKPEIRHCLVLIYYCKIKKHEKIIKTVKDDDIIRNGWFLLKEITRKKLRTLSILKKQLRRKRNNKVKTYNKVWIKEGEIVHYKEKKQK